MEIPRHWRLKKQRYALVGEVCPHCDTKIFPPRSKHQGCQDDEKPIEVRGESTIFSSKSPSCTLSSYTEVLQTQ